MARLSVVGIITMLLTVGSFLIFAPAADAASKPSIKRIESVSTRSAVLVVKFSDFRKKDVHVQVRIKNELTGAVVKKTFGIEKWKKENMLKIMGLAPNTEYSVKVRIRKDTMHGYSHYSDSRKFRTARAAVEVNDQEPAQ